MSLYKKTATEKKDTHSLLLSFTRYVSSDQITEKPVTLSLWTSSGFEHSIKIQNAGLVEGFSALFNVPCSRLDLHLKL